MADGKDYQVGQNFEAKCSQCKEMTQNQILTMTRTGNIGKLKCLVCGKERAYRPPKSKTAGAKKTAAGAKKNEPVVDPAYMEIAEEIENAQAVPYSISAVLKLGDVIEHSVFGRGKVVGAITPDKVEVLFKEGTKTLLCVLGMKTEFV